MAGPRLTLPLLVAALAIIQSGCERSDGARGQGTVTVKLPPARTATPVPGFSRAAAPR